MAPKIRRNYCCFVRMFSFLCHMKYNTVLFLVIFILGCSQRSEQDETKLATDTLKVSKTSPINGQIYKPESELYIWKVTPDYKKMKNQDVNPAFQNADSLILGLNQRYENVFLQKIKLSGDTIYTQIKDANYLTEQMGTTGAEVYLADVVINLASIAGIRYVSIYLEEGSHMQPGVWTLSNFSKYTEAK